MLKPEAVIIGLFVCLVLPLWLFFAWALGLVQIGEETPLDGETPFLVEQTQLDAERLSSCLSKDYSGWLPLTYAASPYRPPNTWRLRNRMLHIVIDVVPRGSGSELRVYKENDVTLDRAHVIALQTCIPEYGLPHAGDPRNDAFYRELRTNSAIESAP